MDVFQLRDRVGDDRLALLVALLPGVPGETTNSAASSTPTSRPSPAFGLMQSVDRDIADAPAALGIKQAAVYTNSRAVCTVLAGMILGAGRALRARNELFGWDSPEWRATMFEAYRKARASLGFEA